MWDAKSNKAIALITVCSIDSGMSSTCVCVCWLFSVVVVVVVVALGFSISLTLLLSQHFCCNVEITVILPLDLSNMRLILVVCMCSLQIFTHYDYCTLRVCVFFLLCFLWFYAALFVLWFFFLFSLLLFRWTAKRHEKERTQNVWRWARCALYYMNNIFTLVLVVVAVFPSWSDYLERTNLVDRKSHRLCDVKKTKRLVFFLLILLL